MAIYRRSGVNTEGICYKSVGCYLYIYIYIYIYIHKAVKTICSIRYIFLFILADQLLTCYNSPSMKLLPQKTNHQ